MATRDQIYRACKALGNGQAYDFLKYDRFVKDPNLIIDVYNNLDKINRLYKLLRASKMPKIERTPYGGIVKHNIHHAGGAWDVEEVYTENNQLKGVIITVIIRGEVFILKCGGFSANKSEISGTRAFRAFLTACKAHNIDLRTYYISNGQEMKKEIEKPYISMFNRYKVIEGVNHLDLNSAWAAGVCVDYPEFKPVFEDLLTKDKLFPSVALGYCQSRYVEYRLTNLPKSGINNGNRAIERLLECLADQDFEIIGINTDGIWYKDPTGANRVYHDADEGHQLGQWKTDYQNVTFMAYGDGQYWFREADGTFNVRARGYYSYERLKSRDKWDEEDFDKAIGTQVVLMWDQEEGFIVYA